MNVRASALCKVFEGVFCSTPAIERAAASLERSAPQQVVSPPPPPCALECWALGRLRGREGPSRVESSRQGECFVDGPTRP